MNKKTARLKKILLKLKKVLIAYSGGVDSDFLLNFAARTLGKENVAAVTALSPTYPKSELARAKSALKKLGVKAVFIRTNELKNRKFAANPRNRCYYCKDELFRRLSALAKKTGASLCDGSNFSDLSDFRPGSKAKKKWKVSSPLAEAGMTKDDIRSAGKKMKLKSWNLPAQACLASRFPYGMTITRRELSRIERGEEYLKKLGIRTVRLRNYGPFACIESDEDGFKLLSRRPVRLKVARKLAELGWKRAVIDIQGYRPGSMNI